MPKHLFEFQQSELLTYMSLKSMVHKLTFEELKLFNEVAGVQGD